MAQKKRLWLTRARIALLVEVIRCLEKSPSGEGYQVRKIFPVLKKRYEEIGERLTGSAIQLVVDTLIKAGILKITDRSTLPGDKAPSILYEFNCEVFASYEVMEVIRNNAEGRKAGKLADVKCPGGDKENTPLAAQLVSTTGVSLNSAIQIIIEKANKAEERVFLATKAVELAQSELAVALVESKEYAQILRNYRSAEESLLQAAQREG